MSNEKPPVKIEIHYTADGSPTINFNGGEKMHSMDGALSESLYIYAPCVEKALDLPCPAILSMGLGLGYNELISLGLLCKANKSEFLVLSFEKEEWLIESFISYLNLAVKESESESESENKKILYLCYQEIIAQIAKVLEIQTLNLIHFTLSAIKQKKFVLSGALNLENTLNVKFNAVLYDAFSGQTDHDLWNTQHLIKFITNYCDDKNCHFSTYAATGDLSRSLKSTGFNLIKKKGYGKKRESTYAFR